jgi:competence protein ComEC
MILGQRGDIPTTLQQAFRDAGVSHLLVVSGLNVSFIAASVFITWRLGLRLLRSALPRTQLPGWRPTPWAAALSLPFVGLYCSLVGWEVPTTRAAVMVSCYLMTRILDRGHDVWHAMTLAAVLILLYEPLAIFDVSLQLSFMAVIAMFLGSSLLPTAQEKPGRWRAWWQHGQAYLLVNAAAYIGTVPILACTFQTVQVYAILANVPLVLLAGLLTPVGVVILGVVMLWPGLGSVALGMLQPPLLWMVTITETIARWPGAQWHLAAPSWGMVLGYYSLLGLGNRRWAWHWRVLCCSGGLVLLLGGGMWQYLDTRVRQLHVTFLDVGSGDAILVQAPGNHHVLVDGGGTYDGRFDVGAQVVAPFLWQRYVRRFRLLALTHPHPNHARGLVSVLRLFPAQHLLTNGTPLQADYLQDLVRAGQTWHTQQHTALHGPRQWQWGGLSMTVLAPPPWSAQEATGWAPHTENDRSLVLRLQYGNTRLLLTGDIEHRTEQWLLVHQPDLQADILQIPHHGSHTSTSPAFVAQVRPTVGVISAGTGNPYGHPHTQVLDVLAAQQVQVWRTDQHGAITIRSDGTHYQVQSFRPYRP